MSELWIRLPREWFPKKVALKHSTKRVCTSTLRKELNSVGRKYICEYCRCKQMQKTEDGWMWNGAPIVLDIDHIHGIGWEGCNTAENLQYLCNICHDQKTRGLKSNLIKASIPFMLN